VRTFEEIDDDLPLVIDPFQQDLNEYIIVGLADIERVTLEGADVKLFLAWAKVQRWREVFEEDLSALAVDAKGRDLLSVHLPLVTFRNQFCGGGRPLQDAATQALMERLRFQTLHWRDAGCDLVCVSGCIRVENRRMA